MAPHSRPYSCPIARFADLLGDSVSLLILRDTLKKPRRFTDLELLYQGVSSRTLTLNLKKLTRAGLLRRVPDYSLGNRVYYHIAPKGRALKSVFEAIRIYGKRHLA